MPRSAFLKRHTTFFLAFFLPLIVVIGCGSIYSYWSLYSLRDEQQFGNTRQATDLQMVEEASRLGHDLLEVQLLIHTTLLQAKSAALPPNAVQEARNK